MKTHHDTLSGTFRQKDVPRARWYTTVSTPDEFSDVLTDLKVERTH
jgi:hypothetical protein